MARDDGETIGKIALGLIGLWVLYEIFKAGAQGKDATISRCGYCNMVLKPYQNPCPNCGSTVIWK